MKEFDTAQVEQLKTIGDYLGRERQEKGISLDEIAIKTYIPLRLLQALELGHVERLPEPVFVQGFIRRYADAIGLDGMALAKTFSPQPSFSVERKTTEPERQSQEPKRPDPAITPVEELIYVPPASIHSERRARGQSYLPLVVGSAAVLLIVAGLVYVLNRPKSLETTTSQSSSSAPLPQQDVTANPERSPSAQASPTPSPTQTGGTPVKESTPAADSSIQVAVNLTDDSWFQVVADGKVEFEGTLKKGEQKTWTAKKMLVLQAGNAGAVSVSYNQGEAKRLGTPGEVKEVTFAANKAKPGAVN